LESVCDCLTPTTERGRLLGSSRSTVFHRVRIHDCTFGGGVRRTVRVRQHHHRVVVVSPPKEGQDGRSDADHQRHTEHDRIQDGQHEQSFTHQLRSSTGRRVVQQQTESQQIRADERQSASCRTVKRDDRTVRDPIPQAFVMFAQRQPTIFGLTDTALTLTANRYPLAETVTMHVRL
jgi:hypothetical protein